MKIATSLTLMAIGAILTFAITASPSFLNLQVAGVILMAVGVAGLLIPKRGQGWLRRRMVLRGGTRGQVVGHVDEARYPPYVMVNPNADEPADGHPQPGDLTAPMPEVQAMDQIADPVTASPATEVVEEYREE